MIQVWKILAGIWWRNWQLAIATGKQPLCMKKEYCYFFLIWGAKFCVTNHLNSSFQCKKVKITKKTSFLSRFNLSWPLTSVNHPINHFDFFLKGYCVKHHGNSNVRHQFQCFFQFTKYKKLHRNDKFCRKWPFLTFDLIKPSYESFWIFLNWYNVKGHWNSNAIHLFQCIFLC